MYIRSLGFTDLRSFELAHLEFLHPGREQEQAFVGAASWPPTLPNVTLLLGVNGAGKTTVLKAIALAILAPILPSSGFRPFALVSRRPGKSWANLTAVLHYHSQDRDPTTSKSLTTTSKSLPADSTVSARVLREGDLEQISVPAHSPKLPELYKQKSPAFFIVGYGATRRVESLGSYEFEARQKSRYERYARVASLFEDHFSMAPLSVFLPVLSSRRPDLYKEAVEILRSLLPKDLEFTEKQHDGGDYLFVHRGVEVPFSALSDGHRAYLGWISDLLYHLSECCPEEGTLGSMVGIVLVDEIDLHIHPSWQLEIISVVARALPSLQFVFTSHSPLVAGTLEKHNLYLVLQGEGRDGELAPPPTVERPGLEMHGLSADQILTSDLFGLSSTRAPEFVEELTAVSQRATRGEPGAALELMQKLAHGKAAAPAKEAPDWVKKAARERQ